jgi:hypothetical protein
MTDVRTARSRPQPRVAADHPRYRWVALSNTTLGMLMATINSSIVLISLPAIFRGISLGPLQPAASALRGARYVHEDAPAVAPVPDSASGTS